MKYVGFIKNKNGTYKEYLPYNEQLCSDKQKRAIFFNMFNMYMEKELGFSKKEIEQNISIEKAFKYKIAAIIDISCVYRYVSKNTFTVDIASTLLIHAYFLGIKINFPLLHKPHMLVGKLISLIYKPSGLSLLLDLEDMFLHLVYERIKKVNRYADVFLYENSIIIKDKREGIADSLIIPSYKKIDKEHLYSDADFVMQMHKVEETINAGDIRQIYLVYPKHPNFEKHINIKLPHQTQLNDDEYRVKIMPYSFSFCSKESRIKSKQQVAA